MLQGDIEGLTATRNDRKVSKVIDHRLVFFPADYTELNVISAAARTVG